ncbi:MAG: DUF2807 domain-containing protein [Actinomycetota bacterium]
MNATTRFLIPTLAAGALLLPACAGTFDLALGEKGSGVAETTTFDVGSFDAVEVGNAFEATIELVDGPSTVEITVDDNFTDDLDVEVKNGRLEIGFDRGVHRVKVDPKVVITVPSLNHVDVQRVGLNLDLDMRCSGSVEPHLGRLVDHGRRYRRSPGPRRLRCVRDRPRRRGRHHRPARRLGRLDDLDRRRRRREW